VDEREHDLIQRELTAPNRSERLTAEREQLLDQCQTPAGADQFICDWEYPHTEILLAYALLKHLSFPRTRRAPAARADSNSGSRG
jgi:hypothetical protein